MEKIEGMEESFVEFIGSSKMGIFDALHDSLSSPSSYTTRAFVSRSLYDIVKCQLTLDAVSSCRAAADVFQSVADGDDEPYRQLIARAVCSTDGEKIFLPLLGLDPDGTEVTDLLIGNVVTSGTWITPVSDLATRQNRTQVVMVRDRWQRRNGLQWLDTTRLQGADANTSVIMGSANPNFGKDYRIGRALFPGKSARLFRQSASDAFDKTAAFLQLRAQAIDLVAELTAGDGFKLELLPVTEIHAAFAAMYILSKQEHLSPDMVEYLQHRLVIEALAVFWPSRLGESPTGRPWQHESSLVVLYKLMACGAITEHVSGGWHINSEIMSEAGATHVADVRNTYPNNFLDTDDPVIATRLFGLVEAIMRGTMHTLKPSD